MILFYLIYALKGFQCDRRTPWLCISKGLTVNTDPREDERRLTDRRTLPTCLWDALRLLGQRKRNRRASESGRLFFVDRFGVITLILVLLMLALSMVDALITLDLLDAGCKEVNPVMSYLLGKGHVHFLLGKYVLTAVGLPILLVFKNFRLFGSCFRVGFLLPIFVGLYLILLCYQLWLCSFSRFLLNS